MAKIGVQAMMLKESFSKVGPFETLRQDAAMLVRSGVSALIVPGLANAFPTGS